jgi:outer membrane protein assembly factor BamA
MNEYNEGARRMRSSILRLTISLCFALGAAPVLAQTPGRPQTGADPQTRAELLLREREEKAKSLHPHQPTALEQGMDLAENRVMPLLQRDGIYAKFGSLTTGSGLAYGGGFRDRSLVRGLGSVDLWAAGSLRKYWALEGRVRYPFAVDDRLIVEAYARRYGYPSEEFFGIGPGSRRVDRSIYTLSGWTAGGQLAVRATTPLSFGGGIEYLRPTARASDDDSLPAVNDLFDQSTAPGQATAHAFVRTLAHVTYDYRQPLNARRGGWYRLEVGRYDDRRHGRFDFTRVDLDLRQFVSVLAERRVFAARVKISTTDAPDGAAVPFFLLPALGGNDTLRGFRAHRFRGPHAILLQGEYRWEVWSGLEGALFVDAGKVASRREDLNLRDLERNYGFGFRFNTDTGVVMRVDAAFGSRDGRHLHVVFGGIF